ncbi:hypothetical protein EVAR_29313_1 [Eumeta japonica]|uniref:Uncharacterized protein n=1 Tax=Eumeta variegata TaxID=151549 RepID=A0A4C1WKB4_EUMVA|nr:hypothetical protein EVAR_29313_1 [Eumeta japonica]
MLDKHLHFRDYIQHVRKLAIFYMLRLSNMIGRKSKMSLRNKRTLYTLCIRPVMTYVYPVFAQAAPTALQDLQVLRTPYTFQIYEIYHPNPLISAAASYEAPPENHFLRRPRNALVDPPDDVTAENRRPRIQQGLFGTTDINSQNQENKFGKAQTISGHAGKYTPSESVPNLAYRFANMSTNDTSSVSNKYNSQYHLDLNMETKQKSFDTLTAVFCKMASTSRSVNVRSGRVLSEENILEVLQNSDIDYDSDVSDNDPSYQPQSDNRTTKLHTENSSDSSCDDDCPSPEMAPSPVLSVSSMRAPSRPKGSS